MLSTQLNKSIKVCEKNGNRLLEDAECLFNYGSNSTVYALVKLAQEEFAKGFILRLVQGGGLKWTLEVRKSLNHHVSKQLMTLILQFLQPETEEFIRKITDGSLFKRPQKVSDAINIYVYEIIKRWESENWEWVETPDYDKNAEHILHGKEEKLKQNAIYVRINKKGEAIDYSSSFTKNMINKEIEKAKSYAQFIGSDYQSYSYNEIIKLLKLMFRV
jgi:AbiV family abortive infection protein